MDAEKTLTKIENFEFTKVGRKIKSVLWFILWVLVGTIIGQLMRGI